MLSTLPQVSHEHHERLLHQIDRMPAVGDLIGTLPPAELQPHIAEVDRFLTGLLLPHMEAAEKTLYPELERLFQNRHSMTPMRREHADIRGQVDEISRLDARLGTGRFGTGETVALRRAFFHLYASLKIHLAEEELYLSIIEHGVADDAADSLAAALEHAGTADF